MVLSDLSLWKLLNDLVRDPEPDPELVNPASIDVRVGREMLVEVGPGEFRAVDLTAGPVALGPGELALVPTLEWLASTVQVPGVRSARAPVRGAVIVLMGFLLVEVCVAKYCTTKFAPQ